ncbi:MAG: hypothetical protein M1818_007879 [Claussenomyces sp. TS43310]|nr:MAG: hypothetical protein M1818_007879 [Claussenomyces sp. TS43310]
MDSTYAPQSPDLSSFLSGSPTQQQPQPQALPSQTSSYAPRSPNLSSFTRPTHAPRQQAVGSRGVVFGGQQAQPQHQQSYGYPAYDPAFQQGGQPYPPIPDLPPAHHFGPQSHASVYQPQSLQQFPPIPYSTQTFKPEPPFDGTADFSYIPNQQIPSQGESHSYPLTTQDEMSSRARRARNVGIKTEHPAESGLPGGALGPSMGIEVKTKFPVARIKRIMQADEEVGKVAQVTPVAVSKALELFMISLVTKSTTLARNGNSKRITAQHLKRAIEGDVQFDFLNDIVGKVVEGPDAGGKRVKDEDDSDDEEGGKASKKARGRKKKGE